MTLSAGCSLSSILRNHAAKYAMQHELLTQKYDEVVFFDQLTGERQVFTPSQVRSLLGEPSKFFRWLSVGDN